MKRKRRDNWLSDPELHSRIEIQEWALRTYEREIYGNIGQILSLAKLQLLGLQVDEAGALEKIQDSGKLLGKAISELRRLTRLLSPDEIIRNGFAYVICHELKRLTELDFCNAVFSVRGNLYSLGDIRELVAFNVLQKLIYAVLKIGTPLKIRLMIRFKIKEVYIEFESDASSQPDMINNEVWIHFRDHLKYINGSIMYKNGNKQILQITVKK